MGLFDLVPGTLPEVNMKAATDWNEEHPVVIIGAGAAGMNAAYTLHCLGVPFLLLEAGKIHGGRTKRTDEFLKEDGIQLDIGAEWIHVEKDTSILGDLILKEEDRAKVEKFMEEETIKYQPQTYGHLYFGSLWRMDWRRHTYHEFKFKTKSWSYFFDEFMLKYFRENLICNAVVKEVDYTSDPIKISLTCGKEYLASRVICAAPVSVLKRGDILFLPPLDEPKQRLLQKQRMKPGFKMAIEFSEHFFVDMACDMGIFEYFFWMLWDFGSERLFFDGLLGKGNKKRHILSVYCYGAHADELQAETATDEKLFQDVLAKLDKMYNGKASKYYVKHLVQNWTQEPHIWGASGDLTMARGMFNEFAQKPLDNRVFFAGEHVAGTKLLVTVQGASLSGRKAAINAIGQEYNPKW